MCGEYLLTVDITWSMRAVKLLYIDNDSPIMNKNYAIKEFYFRNLYIYLDLKEHFAFYTFYDTFCDKKNWKYIIQINGKRKKVNNLFLLLVFLNAHFIYEY